MNPSKGPVEDELIAALKVLAATAEGHSDRKAAPTNPISRTVGSPKALLRPILIALVAMLLAVLLADDIAQRNKAADLQRRLAQIEAQLQDFEIIQYAKSVAEARLFALEAQRWVRHWYEDVDVLNYRVPSAP